MCEERSGSSRCIRGIRFPFEPGCSGPSAQSLMARAAVTIKCAAPSRPSHSVFTQRW